MLVYARERSSRDASSEMQMVKSADTKFGSKSTNGLATLEKVPRFSNLLGGNTTALLPEKSNIKKPNGLSSQATKVVAPFSFDPSKPHPLFGLPINSLKPESSSLPFLLSFNNAQTSDDPLRKRPPVVSDQQSTLKKPVSVSGKSLHKTQRLFQNPRSKLRRFNEILKRQSKRQSDLSEPSIIRARSADLTVSLSNVASEVQRGIMNFESGSEFEIPLRRSRTVEVTF